MKIYVDSEGNIKQLYSSSDVNLKEFEIDRSSIFYGMSDFMILNYKYIIENGVVQVVPNMAIDKLLQLDYDNKINIHDDKISILTQENEKLKISLATVEATHSDLIFDIDFRVMDLEDAVGVNPVGINLFNLKGGDNMNSTFVMLLSKIENGYYDTREEIEAMADRYLARKRISIDEYDILMSALDKKEAEKNPK